jgi:ribosome-associated translation inhibitor RaiA
MTIDTLGYVKRLEAAGVDRSIAEAHMEALSEKVVPQLATKSDLQTAVDRLEQKIDNALLKHTLAVVFAFVAIGGLLVRFMS